MTKVADAPAACPEVASAPTVETPLPDVFDGGKGFIPLSEWPKACEVQIIDAKRVVRGSESPRPQAWDPDGWRSTTRRDRRAILADVPQQLKEACKKKQTDAEDGEAVALPSAAPAAGAVEFDVPSLPAKIKPECQRHRLKTVRIPLLFAAMVVRPVSKK